MQSDVGVTAVADALADAARGISGAHYRLFEALIRIDATGDDGRAWTALELVVGRPRALLRIDMLARSYGWDARPPWLTAAADQLRGGAAGPIALALGTVHPDGHLRERAVRAILNAPARELVAFLAVRTADPVRQVRDRARAGLALLLADDSDEARQEQDLRLALSLAPSLASRVRGGFLHGQVVAALLTTSPERAWRLAQGSSPEARRLVLDLGIAHRWWPIDDLVEISLHEPDGHVRTRAAEALVRDAVWTRRRKTIDRLTTARYPDVRANAVTGLVRLGLDRVATAFLEDRAGTVRAIARGAADRTGVNPVEHYRSALNGEVTTGAIAGLAETGADADGRLVEPLLRHDAPRIRVAAVRAHRALDPGAGHALIDMLDDPSRAVLREVTLALRNVTVPPELVWGLLNDAGSVDRRRAGYRLLSWGVAYDQLRAALVAGADPDPQLARRARGDLRRIVRDATGETWRRRQRPDLRVTADQLAELRRLVPVAAWTVGATTTRQLSAWLDAVPATG